MARMLDRTSSRLSGGIVLVLLAVGSGAIAREQDRGLKPSSNSNARVVVMEVTAYCPCSKCCGKHARGVTASGHPVSYNDGAFAAADTNVLPFHTKLLIPGYAGERPVEVLDRGGAIKGHRLDVFFPTHREAKAWGRRRVEVQVVGEK